MGAQCSNFPSLAVSAHTAVLCTLSKYLQPSTSSPLQLGQDAFHIRKRAYAADVKNINLNYNGHNAPDSQVQSKTQKT